jgi:hypothetical protein
MSTNFNWSQVSVSSSGQYQTAAASYSSIYGSFQGGIYYNSNYGVGIWTQNTSASSILNWGSISMSSSGQYQTAVIYAGGIYYNSNYGIGNWTVSTAPTPTNGNWRYVAVSSCGHYQTAITTTSGGGVYTSVTNYRTYYSTSFTLNGTAKTFVIDHPLYQDKYLVHSCVEGPEDGVYYRGKGFNDGGSVVISLPDYVLPLAHSFTVHVTPIGRPRLLHTSPVEQGRFTVSGDSGPFYWMVYGTRNTITVEPERDQVVVMGEGPYTYLARSLAEQSSAPAKLANAH